MQEAPTQDSVSSRGFTLLELLIVCLLISISLGLSIPSLRSTLTSDDLAAGSRKVISLVKSSRAKAVTDQEAYLIFYDSAERKLWYQKADDEKTTDTSAAITLPSDVYIQDIKQAGGGSAQDTMNSGIWISREGYMDKTVIQLADMEGKSLNLVISPFLPTINVTEGPVTFP
ncbi:MAG: prepilin-type N-terminal cleavage/methylation domain-containing protein [Desulfocapsa sp.]|nr:prepilin-type N-terminal cleavage/methylation domain-containing protein [Desulfocapsa sp.]